MDQPLVGEKPASMKRKSFEAMLFANGTDDDAQQLQSEQGPAMALIR